MLQNDIQVYAPKSYLNAPQYSLGNNKFKLVENEQVLTEEDLGTSCVTQHLQILFLLVSFRVRNFRDEPEGEPLSEVLQDRSNHRSEGAAHQGLHGGLAAASSSGLNGRSKCLETFEQGKS